MSTMSMHLTLGPPRTGPRPWGGDLDFQTRDVAVHHAPCEGWNRPTRPQQKSPAEAELFHPIIPIYLVATIRTPIAFNFVRALAASGVRGWRWINNRNS